MTEHEISKAGICDRTVDELQLIKAADQGVPSGFPGFTLPGGFKPGDLSIIASPSGGGKSLFALTLFQDLVSRSRKASFVSLEAEETWVLKTLVSLRLGLSFSRLLSGMLHGPEISAVLEAIRNIKADPNLDVITVRDGNARGLADLIARQVHWHESQAAIVDGLILTREGVAASALALKRTAMRLGIPVITTLPQSRLPEVEDLADSIICLNLGPSLGDAAEPAGFYQHSAEVVVRKNRGGHVPQYTSMIFDFDLKQIRAQEEDSSTDNAGGL